MKKNLLVIRSRYSGLKTNEVESETIGTQKSGRSPVCLHGRVRKIAEDYYITFFNYNTNFNSYEDNKFRSKLRHHCQIIPRTSHRCRFPKKLFLAQRNSRPNSCSLEVTLKKLNSFDFYLLRSITSLNNRRKEGAAKNRRHHQPLKKNSLISEINIYICILSTTKPREAARRRGEDLCIDNREKKAKSRRDALKHPLRAWLVIQGNI